MPTDPTVDTSTTRPGNAPGTPGPPATPAPPPSVWRRSSPLNTRQADYLTRLGDGEFDAAFTARPGLVRDRAAFMLRAYATAAEHDPSSDFESFAESLWTALSTAPPPSSACPCTKTAHADQNRPGEDHK